MREWVGYKTEADADNFNVKPIRLGNKKQDAIKKAKKLGLFMLFGCKPGADAEYVFIES